MTLNEIFKEIGLDRYDRNARIGPALFAILPVGALFAVWTPDHAKAAGAFSAVVLSCGAAYLLKGIARSSGAKAEERLLRRLGGWPSTLAMRRGGPLLDDVTRTEYRRKFKLHGQVMPSDREEATDPVRADALYGRAVGWLLSQTRRPDHPSDKLLLEENIEYGFRKNIVGLKLHAIFILITCMLVNILELLLMYNPSNDKLVSAVILTSFYLACFALWIFVLNDRFVEESSWKYAKRLLSSLDTL